MLFLKLLYVAVFGNLMSRFSSLQALQAALETFDDANPHSLDFVLSLREENTRLSQDNAYLRSYLAKTT
jgi:hypothetical protein